MEEIAHLGLTHDNERQPVDHDCGSVIAPHDIDRQDAAGLITHAGSLPSRAISTLIKAKCFDESG
jgi:hypothetical protein